MSSLQVVRSLRDMGYLVKILAVSGNADVGVQIRIAVLAYIAEAVPELEIGNKSFIINDLNSDQRFEKVP